MKKARFKAELIEGHKGLTAVLVPFDPEAVWKAKPLQLAGRRFGWVVKGSLNGEPFDGYIGLRWERFFLLIDAAQRSAADVTIGDLVDVVVAPCADPEAVHRAYERSKRTTQPKTGRADALPTSFASSRQKRLDVARRPRNR